jgi:DNA-binding transcriptional MerR regulator
MGNYQIKDLESITGIKAHTIRIWEQRYGIVTPQRTKTNIRYYTDKDARRLMNIAILNKNGFKISRIKELTDEEINHEAMRFAFTTLDYKLQIDFLISTMVEMDEMRFEKVLSNNILQSGFEKTLINIVFPFLNRIGLMWQTGAISPAQEHFISNLIRQKIVVAIDSLPVVMSPAPQKVLLFLPENEQHELSLLFTNFIFRSRGYHTIYLGQQTPVEEVLLIYDKYKPEYLFSVYTNFANDRYLNTYTDKILTHCQNSTYLLTGYQALQNQAGWPDRVRLIRSFDDLLNLVDAGKTPQPVEKH